MGKMTFMAGAAYFALTTIGYSQSLSDVAILSSGGGDSDNGIIAGLVVLAILGVIFGSGGGAVGSSKSPKLETKKPKSKILQKF